MAQNSDLNLFVLTKLVQAPIPDDVKFQFDGDLVTKVKMYFYIGSLEMSPEGILIRKAIGLLVRSDN